MTLGNDQRKTAGQETWARQAVNHPIWVLGVQAGFRDEPFYQKDYDRAPHENQQAYEEGRAFGIFMRMNTKLRLEDLNTLEKIIAIQSAMQIAGDIPNFYRDLKSFGLILQALYQGKKLEEFLNV